MWWAPVVRKVPDTPRPMSAADRTARGAMRHGRSIASAPPRRASVSEFVEPSGQHTDSIDDVFKRGKLVRCVAAPIL